MSEYISNSSIDRPPSDKISKRDAVAEQNELFEKENHEQQVDALLNTAVPAGFEFKLTLVLKALQGNENPTTLPVAAGQCYSDRVEEVLIKQFKSEYFVQRLRAIVGEPLKDVQTELDDLV